jgi:leucyl aminopeptidase
MKIAIKKGDAAAWKTEALVFGLWEGEPLTQPLKPLNKALNGVMEEAIRTKEFEGRSDQAWVIHSRGAIPAKRVILVGLGKKKERGLDQIRQGMGRAAQKVRECGAAEFTTSIRWMGGLPAGSTPQSAAQAMTEGILLGLYRFNRYRTKEEVKTKEIAQAVFLEEETDRAAVTEGVRTGETIAGAVTLARDLVNLPANDMTPTLMAKAATEMAGRTQGVRCRVLSKRDVEKIGMGAFLGVAQGSEQPPKFIILEYKGGKKGSAPIALVGKSITFDSGGISIKPSDGMEKMKYDMAGGAATLGTIQAAAQLRLPVNLIGLLPATENLPSGTATKPGDIHKSLAGLTIEVVNTDAEGRLVLADALAYSLRYKPAAIVDMATLTGACVVALGSQAIGMAGNDKALKERMVKAGEETAERVWEMPLWEEYQEQIRSPIADLKNTGGREGGMITAAAFLSRFVDKTPWVHLDIAGTAWKEKDTPYIPKGAVGVGVRLMVQFLQDWGKK